MLKVHEPLTLVLDLLSDQVRKLAIRVIDPATGVPSVLNQRETLLGKEKGEVSKDTVLFFEEDLELHL